MHDPGRLVPGVFDDGEHQSAPSLQSDQLDDGAFIGPLDENTDIGYQNYKGIKFSAVRRAGSGLTVNGNYTLSVCKGTPTALTVQPGECRVSEAGRSIV
jgi:hypothetical protein